ncbi:hypothetical protein DW061_03970 [Ruminococcus sp. AF42-9BH]|nr:hypothetical protein DW061_03970 [Ruminococcus sp. AF42-9BH]
MEYIYYQFQISGMYSYYEYTNIIKHPKIPKDIFANMNRELSFSLVLNIFFTKMVLIFML